MNEALSRKAFCHLCLSHPHFLHRDNVLLPLEISAYIGAVGRSLSEASTVFTIVMSPCHIDRPLTRNERSARNSQFLKGKQLHLGGCGIPVIGSGEPAHGSHRLPVPAPHQTLTCTHSSITGSVPAGSAPHSCLAFAAAGELSPALSNMLIPMFHFSLVLTCSLLSFWLHTLWF